MGDEDDEDYPEDEFDEEEESPRVDDDDASPTPRHAGGGGAADDDAGVVEEDDYGEEDEYEDDPPPQPVPAPAAASKRPASAFPAARAPPPAPLAPSPSPPPPAERTPLAGSGSAGLLFVPTSAPASPASASAPGPAASSPSGGSAASFGPRSPAGDGGGGGGAGGGGGGLDAAVLELVRLVRPSTGKPGSPAKIWECVARRGTRLPGKWDTTPSGAVKAARASDWPLCAYLAAWCAREKGPEALARPDAGLAGAVWTEVVAPIVVEVPPEKPHRSTGSGALCKPRPGPIRGNADCFKVGATLQLAGSRIKRMQLEPQETLELRALLLNPGAPKPSFLNRKTGLTYVAGGWFRVLAYPLAGDPGKALLRPEARGWSRHQVQFVRRVGENLLSQCAKAGQFDLVATLLRGKVPCPDLSVEFEDACGPGEVIKKQWARDLQTTVGSAWVRRPFTLLEIAAWESGKNSSAFRDVLRALLEPGDPGDTARPEPDLTGGKTHKPLIVAAAESSRWDIVLALLDEDVVPPHLKTGASSVVELLESSVLVTAPPEVLPKARARAQLECQKHPQTLREYFRNLIAGEVMTPDMVPGRFRLRPGGMLLEAPDGAKALAVGLRLGAGEPRGSGAAAAAAGKARVVTVFVRVTEDELEDAAGAAAHSENIVLAVSLDGREVAIEDPGPAQEGGSCWLAVSCPVSFLRRTKENSVFLQVPVNCIPTPSLLPSVPVRVQVVTPCCRVPLGGVPIYVAGRRLGLTDADGMLCFRLPQGRFTISAPGHVAGQKDILADPSAVRSFEVQMMSTGDLFFYVQDQEEEEEEEQGEEAQDSSFPRVAPADFVMLCTNPLHVQPLPDGARDFAGTASMKGQHGTATAAAVPVLRVKPDENCADQLKALRVRPAGNCTYKANEEVAGWLSDFASECPLALMYSTTPKRIGDMVAEAAEAGSDAGAPLQVAHASGQRGRVSEVHLRRDFPASASKPRPFSASSTRSGVRSRAAQLRRLPQKPSPYRAESPWPQVGEGVLREGGCCTNPLYWPDYHYAWRA